MVIHWTSKAVFRHVSGNANASISHAINPLPNNDQRQSNESYAMFIYSLITVIGWSLIPTAAIVFIVKERESLSKWQQYVSGVDPLSYWASNLLFDMTKFVFTAGSSVLVL